jgi:hypothetical protein
LGLTTYITSCLATTVSCPWVTKPWPLGRGGKGGVFFSFLIFFNYFFPPSFSWGGRRALVEIFFHIGTWEEEVKIHKFSNGFISLELINKKGRKVCPLPRPG